MFFRQGGKLVVNSDDMTTDQKHWLRLQNFYTHIFFCQCRFLAGFTGIDHIQHGSSHVMRKSMKILVLNLVRPYYPIWIVCLLFCVLSNKFCLTNASPRLKMIDILCNNIKKTLLDWTTLFNRSRCFSTLN